MRFSLVVATLGRPEIRGLLASLSRQSMRDFEVIIVDQGPGDIVATAVSDFSEQLNVRLLRSERGLSKARNVGLAAAQGEIIAFPDDDCWYGPDVLAQVERLLREDADRDGVSGRCIDEAGQLAAGGHRKKAGVVNHHNVWHSGVSTALFLSRNIFRQIGGFDEGIGLGSAGPFQSGEETDILLRALECGFTLHFDPALTVFHPSPPNASAPGRIARSVSYALGMGRVLRQHDTSLFSVLGWCGRGCAGAGWALVCADLPLARLRLARAWGIFAGWRAEGDVQKVDPPAWIAALTGDRLGRELRARSRQS